MIRHAARPAPARASLVGAALPGLVLALIAGLVWMHALSGGHHLVEAPMPAHGGSVSASIPGDDGSVASAARCGGHDRPSDCPPGRSERPGPLCQSAAVPSVVMPAAPGPSVAVDAAPLRPAPVSAVTVAGDAGAGTGCGPPSLTLLSISRR